MNPAVAGQLDKRMTADELAKAIGVNTASISHWRRRNVGFPSGRSAGGVRTYSVRELLAWLDGREVPMRRRRASEGFRATYGDRLRHYLSAMAAEIVLRDVDALPQAAMAQLNALCGKYFGQVEKSAVLDAALLLTFVWITSPDEWKAIRSADGRLDTISAEADQVLRRFGFDVTADAVLQPLDAGNSDALKRLVGQCKHLGIKGFESILTQFAEEFGRTPATYRTPREIAELMGACAVPMAAPLGSVADLFNRQGELVMAVPSAHGKQSPTLYAVGDNLIAAWRTRMHLIVRGRVGTAVAMTDSAPWRRRHRTGPFDAVVVNPPFNRLLGSVSKQVRWKYGSPPPHNSNLAWVQSALAATSPRGRAVVLMPVAEAGSRADRNSDEPRRNLVDSGALRAIIRLSDDLFPASSAGAAIWVLEHPRPGRGGHAITFIDATQLKHKESQRFRPHLVGVSAIADLIQTPGRLAPGETRELVVEVRGSKAIGRAVAVSTSQVAAQGYVLTPDTYLGPVTEKIDVHLQRIQRDADVMESARKRIIELPYRSVTAVRRKRDSSGLPSGWDTVRLGDLCDIKAGPSKLRSSEFTTGDDGVVGVLRPRNLHPRQINTSDMARTTRSVANQFAAWDVEQNDLLHVRVGKVENLAIVGPEHHGYLIDSNLTRLRPNPDTVVPRYLLEFLLRGANIDQIRATATVNVAPSMSGSKLADFRIALPPLAEQRVIVEILAEHEHRATVLRNAMLAEDSLRRSLAEGLMTGSVGLTDREL